MVVRFNKQRRKRKYQKNDSTNKMNWNKETDIHSFTNLHSGDMHIIYWKIILTSYLFTIHAEKIFANSLPFKMSQKTLLVLSCQ